MTVAAGHRALAEATVRRKASSGRGRKKIADHGIGIRGLANTVNGLQRANRARGDETNVHLRVTADMVTVSSDRAGAVTTTTVISVHESANNRRVIRSAPRAAASNKGVERSARRAIATSPRAQVNGRRRTAGYSRGVTIDRHARARATIGIASSGRMDATGSPSASGSGRRNATSSAREAEMTASASARRAVAQTDLPAGAINPDQ